MEKDTPNSIKRKCTKEIDDVDSEDDDEESEDDDSDDYSGKDGSTTAKNKSLSVKKSPSGMEKLVCETCGENVDNEEYFETKDYIFCSEECMERGPIHEKQAKKVLHDVILY